MNAVLKKEAAYFGDIEILPFMDRYELVVLKTVAICEFGVCSVSFLLMLHSLNMNRFSFIIGRLFPSLTDTYISL